MYLIGNMGAVFWKEGECGGVWYIDPSTILQGVLKSNLLMFGCFWKSLVSIKGLKKILIYGNLEICCMKTTVFWGTLVDKHCLTATAIVPCGTSYISLARRAGCDQQIQRDNFPLITILPHVDILKERINAEMLLIGIGTDFCPNSFETVWQTVSTVSGRTPQQYNLQHLPLLVQRKRKIL